VQIPRQVERACGAKARPGFSAIELVVALVIAALLGSVAYPQITKYSSQRAAMNARDAFIGSASQARAAAIRLGEDVEMQVDRTADRVLVTLRRDGSTVAEPLDLRTGSIRGQIVGDGGLTLCYTPRGFMLPNCGNGSTAVGEVVVFASPQGTHTAGARITLGRVERQ
jgi:prepilin-type N-terminal cleavage/methylation domain-containing protein